MIARYLHLVVFCALIIIVAAAIKTKNSDTNPMKDHTEPAYSRPSLLRHLAENKEEQPTPANLA